MAQRKSFIDEETAPLIEKEANDEAFEEAGCGEKAFFGARALVKLAGIGSMAGAGFALIVCRGLIRSEVVDVVDAEETCSDIYGYSMATGAIIGLVAFLYGAYRVYTGEDRLAKTSTTAHVQQALSAAPAVASKKEQPSEPDVKVEAKDQNQQKEEQLEARSNYESVRVEESIVEIRQEVSVEESRPWYRRCC